jgi:glycopeptide antibiotics resistance protein
MPHNLNGPPERPHLRPRKSTARLLWGLFSLFVLYGTTFPFSFRHGGISLNFIQERISWSPFTSISDMIQNILLFIPFGFLGYFSLIYKSSRLRKWAIVALGCLLSTSVEFLQIFSWSRFPALADIVFNTLGAALGLRLAVLLKKSVLGFKSHPSARRFLDAPSAFPALVFIMLVVGGCWEPFNFSLELGGIWAHIKPLIHNPWHFTLPQEDLFAGIQFILATLFVCRVFSEGGWPRPGLSGITFMLVLGLVLESSQIIIGSRYPEVQDALVGIAGTLVGGWIYYFPGFRERPWTWSMAGAIGVMASAAMRGLHPYQFKSSPTAFNWVPFLPQYEKTTAIALGNFIANGMVYFPLGFLIGYFFPRSKRAPWVALGLSAIMALLVEAAQGWVVGRYSDITDVIGAMLGCLVGSLVLTRGWSAFTVYMRQEEDKQV